MVEPGAVKFGSERPSPDGPRLLKKATVSICVPELTRVTPSTSTYCVFDVWAPTQRMRLAVAGMPMVFATLPARNQLGAAIELSKNCAPATAHMSNVPVPNV